MKKQHKILVCSTCASTWQDGKKVGISGGQKLLEKLTEEAQNWSLKDEFIIESINCMSACSHSCVVAFTAPNKQIYLFGSLPYDVDNLSTITSTILDCADLYKHKLDGVMPRSERPELLKKGIIACIPNSD
jgi:predicted metal-binding protein